ncbi:MAG: hypothetical protein K0R38_6038 [Polyangiaceae bacterium]|jgi:hypothetical protein|nr:hypothetical protein [Polyangiaceae bacterium]
MKGGELANGQKRDTLRAVGHGETLATRDRGATSIAAVADRNAR